MTSEDLIELLEKHPFLPLRLHMSNGRTHEIRHPEMAIVSRDVVAIGVTQVDERFPRLRLVSIPHIDEVEPISDSTGADA